MDVKKFLGIYKNNFNHVKYKLVTKDKNYETVWECPTTVKDIIKNLSSHRFVTHSSVFNIVSRCPCGIEFLAKYDNPYNIPSKGNTLIIRSHTDIPLIDEDDWSCSVSPESYDIKDIIE